MGAPNDSRLRAFAWLWVVDTAWSFMPWDTFYGGGDTVAILKAIDPLGAVALCCGIFSAVTWPKFLYPALLLKCFMTLSATPMIWDSDYWCVMVDFSIVVSCCFSEGGLEAAKSNAAAQFQWFYFAAAFWKLNWAFFSKNSCSVVFFEQIAARIGLGEPLAWLVASSAPWATLLLEFTVGGLLVSRRDRLGALCALLLHFVICFTPDPNDISPFGLKCATRLLMVATASGTARVFYDYKVRALCVAYAAFCFTIVDTTWTPKQIATLLFLSTAGFVSACLVSSEDSKRAKGNAMFALVAFLYSFGGLLTGFQEQGTPNMFANLKLYGEGEHLLLPTGLLLHREIGPFAGGIVRVRETSSVWMNSVYPANMTSTLGEKTISLMRAGGADPPAYFNAGFTRVIGEDDSFPFSPYTIPALELRRLVDEAISKDENFAVVYDRLPGTRGDEDWRARATDKTITAVFSEKKIESCVQQAEDGAESPCDEDEIALRPMSQVPWLVRRLSLYHPYPIVTDSNGDIPRYIPCFGP